MGRLFIIMCMVFWMCAQPAHSKGPDKKEISSATPHPAQTGPLPLVPFFPSGFFFNTGTKSIKQHSTPAAGHGTGIFSGQFAAEPDHGLAPVTVMFSAFVAQGKEPFVYDYDFGDGTSAQNASRQVSHTFQQPGDYTVTVTVTDAAGSQSDLTTAVRVLDTQDLADNQSGLRDNADEAALAATPSDMGDILSEARNLIDQSLRAVATADDALRDSVETAVRQDAGDLVANTRDKLGDWIVNDQILAAEVEAIARGLGDVISDMVRNSLPVSEQTLADVRAVSRDVFVYMADELLKNENLDQPQKDAIKSDSAAARAYFGDKPWLLDDVVDVSGIKVDVSTPFDTAAVELAALDHGLNLQQTALLLSSVESTPNASQTVALSSVSQNTIAQVAELIFNTYSTGKQVVQSFSDPIARNILLAFDDGTYAAFLVNRIMIVDDYAPPGLYILPDGTCLGIIDAYAVNYVAYPVYPMSLSAGLIKSGINLFLSQNGSLSVSVAPKAELVTRAGWALLAANTLSGMTVSFSVTGGTDPAAEAFSLLVTYDTGTSQLLPPTVHAMDSLSDAFDYLFPGIWSVDNDTGVITVGTLQLKPDYVFSDLAFVDYNAITAAGGFVYNTVGFAVADYNGDGLYDFGFYSDNPTGFQILYSL